MSPISAARHFWRPVLYSILAGVTVYLAVMLPSGRTIESMCYDLFSRLAPPPSTTSDLLIVAIDEPSFQEIGLPWPWPRSLHAQLVSRLSEAGAKAIVFDVVFAEPTDQVSDTAFAEAIQDAGNVILAASIDHTFSPSFMRQILILPLDLFGEQAAGAGLAMIRPDEDGVVRRFSSTISTMPSLPKAVLDTVAPEFEQDLPAGFIRFAGPAMSIPHVSYYQILDSDYQHPQEQIRGKIVFIGQSLAISPTPADSADTFRTPYSSKQSPVMAGVEIQASIFATLLAGPPVSDAPVLVYYSCTLVLFLLLSLLLFEKRAMTIVLIGSVATVGLLMTSFAAFLILDIWFPPVLPAFGCLLLSGITLTDGYVVVSRQRAWIKNAFSRYIAPEVVSLLTTHPERLKLGGEEVDATVMFLDLAGFTTLSEKLSPAEVIPLLSEIFAPLTTIIKQEHGTLDKFIGDAIMAFWGAPIPQSDHAIRACRAALAMQHKLEEINHSFKAKGATTIHARIGLHSGSLVVGNVGSLEHFNYTCLGDTVNLASRLESANKLYGTDIMISHETVQRLDETFLFRKLDRLRVKGRNEPTIVYELISPGQKLSPEWLSLFEQARRCYACHNFDQALPLLESLLQTCPKDRPSQVLLQRCRQFNTSPPPPDWDSVWPPPGSPPPDK